jgi:hypothetical protein
MTRRRRRDGGLRTITQPDVTADVTVACARSRSPT